MLRNTAPRRIPLYDDVTPSGPYNARRLHRSASPPLYCTVCNPWSLSSEVGENNASRVNRNGFFTCKSQDDKQVRLCLFHLDARLTLTATHGVNEIFNEGYNFLTRLHLTLYEIPSVKYRFPHMLYTTQTKRKNILFLYITLLICHAMTY